jgi:hypothetical protein
MERKYIIDSKKEFYKSILNKINNNLKKRNLDPIFDVSKETKKVKDDSELNSESV